MKKSASKVHYGLLAINQGVCLNFYTRRKTFSVLNLLPKIITQPSLVAMNLVKVDK